MTADVYQREYLRRFRHAARIFGCCRDCGKPVDGKRRCEQHLAMHATRERRRRARLELLVVAGVIVPGIVAPSLRTGDPSPQRWVEAPTLRLEGVALSLVAEKESGMLNPVRFEVP